MNSKGITYRCAPDITWVRDSGQTLLVDAQTRQSWSLRGAEVAMWDWLTLAYPYEKLIRFISLLLRAPADDAKRMLLTTLLGWQDAGIVEIARENNCGESGDQCRM